MGVRGISCVDFLRLIVTVLSVVFLYVPLSLYLFKVEVSVQFHRFSWSNIHGPLWKYIVKVGSVTGKAPWQSWTGIALAITLFIFAGFTRNAKESYEHFIEWIYDHLPSKLRGKIGGMRKISENCKKRSATQKALNSVEAQVMNNLRRFETPNYLLTSSKPTEGNRIENWFDGEYVDEVTLHSSNATPQYRKE